jgi:hypothetical protein
LRLGRSDLQFDPANAIDVAVDAVAGNDRAHAFGRAGEDQVAGLQVIKPRKVGNQFRDIQISIDRSDFWRG